MTFEIDKWANRKISVGDRPRVIGLGWTPKASTEESAMRPGGRGGCAALRRN